MDCTSLQILAVGTPRIVQIRPTRAFDDRERLHNGDLTTESHNWCACDAPSTFYYLPIYRLCVDAVIYTVYIYIHLSRLSL